MVADLHNDFVTSEKYPTILEEYLKTDDVIVGAVYKGKRSYGECKRLAEEFSKVGCERLFLAFEDLSYDVSYEKLEKLLDLRPVYVTLTWNGDCILGGGAGGESGLTARGADVVKMLNERDIFVDVAHLNKRTFYDVIGIAKKVVCSHTAFSAVLEHVRNIDDGQISELVKRGAKIGLCFYTYFLSGSAKADVEDVFYHIDHFASKFGSDSLCIGTDFYGCESLPENMGDYSFAGVIKARLTASGYDDGDIDKILYKNACGILSGRN